MWRCRDSFVALPSYVNKKKIWINIRIICQICPYQQTPTFHMSSKRAQVLRLVFVFWKRSTQQYVWDENLQFIILWSMQTNTNKPAIANRKKPRLPVMLIVPPLSLNPPSLIPLPQPPPPYEKPVEMPYFYPPLFTLSFNLVTLWPDQCLLEIDVISLAHFRTCVGTCGCACVSSCVLILPWTGIKTNQFETPCSLLPLHLL